MADQIAHMADVDAPYAQRIPVPDENAPTVRAVPRKPYRSPREWLPTDEMPLFGKSATQHLNWHTPHGDLETALLAAAKQQSSLAFTIRVRAGARTPTPVLATSVDLHVDTVRGILNGTQHANLAVLNALTTAVGLTLTATAKAVDQPGERDT